MKKKFLATLLVSAVALTAVAGLTACGGNNGGTGAVTAEEWTAAFEETANANNFTAEINREMSMEYKITMEGQEITSASNSKTEGTMAFDFANKKSYGEGKVTSSVSGDNVPDEAKGEKVEETKSYSKVDGKVIWECEYDKVNDEWDAESNEFATEAEATEKFSEIEFKEALSEKMFYAALPAQGEAKSLSELHSSFTYANEKYTATLFAEATPGVYSEIKITISIKDGYVTYFHTESGTNSEGMSITVKASYTLSKIGTTQVTEPAAALKAIEDAKVAA